MGRHVRQMGMIRNLYNFIVRKVDGRILAKCEDVGWNNLTQDGVQLQDLMEHHK
jgi:hypothetical protein